MCSFAFMSLRTCMSTEENESGKLTNYVKNLSEHKSSQFISAPSTDSISERLFSLKLVGVRRCKEGPLLSSGKGASDLSFQMSDQPK